MPAVDPWQIVADSIAGLEKQITRLLAERCTDRAEIQRLRDELGMAQRTVRSLSAQVAVEHEKQCQ